MSTYVNDIEKLKEYLLPSIDKLIYVSKALGLENKIIKHCHEVADLSLKIVEEVERDGIEVNKRIVEAGALLHDIGLAKVCDDNSPEHSVIGADMIRKLGLPDRVAMCAEVHEFHGGVTYHEAKEMQYPILPLRESYAPSTIEEKIVTVADLFIFIIIEGPEEYGFKKIDPWNNLKEAIEETAFPYCRAVYQKKLGKSVDKNHPILKRAYEINKDFIKYVKPTFFK